MCRLCRHSRLVPFPRGRKAIVSTLQRDAPTPTPEQLGIGMRVSVHPHCDNFVEVILGALDDVASAGHARGLRVCTDPVGTHLSARDQPAEQLLAQYLISLVGAAHRRSAGGHVVAHVLLSRGCPGEVSCDLQVAGLSRATRVELAPAGLRASAAWSLYPLATGDASIDVIYRAIERARARGTVSDGMHFATRLDGDLADVVATAVDAWAEVGESISHVVTHLTLSVGSPTGATPSLKES